MKRSLPYLLLGALLGLTLAACSSQASTTAAPPATQVVCPEATPCPEAPAGAEVVVPFEADWAGSAHADATGEPFNHWNDADPQEIPTSCARCHSTPGYRDFVGADGSAAGVVDKAAPIGTVITCEACHNDATVTLSSVVMPSGAEITGLGPSARCMVCHQGRESGLSVDNKLTDLGLTDTLDTPSADLGFINIHYFAAAATLFGSQAHGGYEYPGQSYQARFNHVDGYTECIDCHNQHTLEVRVDACAGCHAGVTTVEDLKNTRMNGSLVDYDGDGNTTEGIYYEIEGLRDTLYTAMQAYAQDVAGTPIAYSAEFVSLLLHRWQRQRQRRRGRGDLRQRLQRLDGPPA